MAAMDTENDINLALSNFLSQANNPQNPPESDISNGRNNVSPEKTFIKRPGGPIANKVTPDVKRRRKNYQAKKMVLPRNPLMLLNQLKPGLVFDVEQGLNGFGQNSFLASVQIDGQIIQGQGNSKKEAQSDAAEEALKKLYFNKMMQLLEKCETDGKAMDTSNEPTTPNTSFPEDDLPWGELASYALFKLQGMWPKSKTFSPIVTEMDTTERVHAESKGTPGKLPANATELDPVMLLHQIYPKCQFFELPNSALGNVTVFNLKVIVDGQEYTGSATKKKLAKKICAKNALKVLGVHYAD